MRNLGQRLVAGLGLLCGVGALVFAIVSRPAALGTLAVPAPTRAAAGAVVGLMPWPEVAARLQMDLRLDAAQGTVLESALAACEEALERAGENPDALWRDRLEKRARRDAYEKLVAVLKGEQQADFKRWLAATAHQNMACWFYSDSNCGCGGKK